MCVSKAAVHKTRKHGVVAFSVDDRQDKNRRARQLFDRQQHSYPYTHHVSALFLERQIMLLGSDLLDHFDYIQGSLNGCWTVNGLPSVVV